jgi:hypothetical protein
VDNFRKRERWAAISAARGLALRMEGQYPIVAAAVLNAEPTLEQGVLVLAFGEDFDTERGLAHEYHRVFRFFTDHEVIVRRS